MKKPKIIGSAPTLLVKDVIASANYYRDRVGFTYERFWGEPPCFCILWRDNFHIMLSQVEESKYIVPHYKAVEKMWNVYFWVDDVEALHKELRERGATIDYDLCNTVVESSGSRTWTDTILRLAKISEKAPAKPRRL